jgi:hypothetical protein
LHFKFDGGGEMNGTIADLLQLDDFHLQNRESIFMAQVI